MSTHKIPTQNLPRLAAQIGKLSRRARRLGQPPITLKTLGTETVLQCVVTEPHECGTAACQGYINYTTVEVEGERPIINGWVFVARLEHTSEGNIIRSVPGEELPQEYREVDPWCEHCQLRRIRRDTFVVRREDGPDYKQVGSNCLADFLGHKDPHTVAAYAELLGIAEEFAGNMEQMGWGGGEPFALDTENFLAHIAATIRLYGWRSKKQAWEEGGVATATLAQNWLLSSRAERLKFHHEIIPTEADAELARMALAWAQEIPSDTPSDYLSNLRVACLGAPFMVLKWAGIVGSAIVAYRREIEKWEERKANGSRGKHLGEIGERITVEATVIMERDIETDFGLTRLYKFETTDGSQLIWFASNAQDCGEGDKIKVAGTVKRHDEYNGRPQTVVNRCKVSK